MTVPTIGEQACFPEFQDGQVLTHNDLNVLRDFLYGKYVFQNRALFGWGVACGLRGSVLANTTLDLSPGFGLAGGGRELLYADALSTPCAAITAAGGVTYDFIDTAPGGFTAILRAKDTPQPAGGECTDEGCDTHTELVCQDAEIVFVAGRLALSGVADDPAFDLAPVDPSGTTITGFDVLKAGLIARLTPLLDGATLTMLSELTLTGTPGTDLMKVGVLNEVLYSLWEYLRCTASQSADCFGAGGAPALALGWLHLSGGAWSWDCTYRHHFALSPALYAAMRGQRCQDVCRQSLDRIRELLQDFEVPEVPTDPGQVEPPSDPPHFCTPQEMRLGLCGRWGPLDPTRYFVDPREFRRPWPGDPGWVDPLPPDYLSGLRELDPLNGGLIRIQDMVGFRGTGAQDVTGQLIQELGLAPQIHVVPVGDLAGVEGFAPGLTASPSDTIYFGVNDAGAVVSTGSVPTARTLREVSGALPGVRQGVTDARGVAESALSAASAARSLAETADGGWRGVNTEFTQFRAALPEPAVLTQRLNETWDFFRNWDGTRAGLVTQLDTARQTAMDSLQASLVRQFTEQLTQTTLTFTNQLSTFSAQLTNLQGQILGATNEIATLRGSVDNFRNVTAKSNVVLRGMMATTLQVTSRQLGEASPIVRDMNTAYEGFETDLRTP